MTVSDTSNFGAGAKFCCDKMKYEVEYGVRVIPHYKFEYCPWCGKKL